MLRHVVLIKFRVDINQEHIEQMAAGFEHLAAAIPVVKALSHGSDLALMEGSYDYAMTADFDSEKDWSCYRDHADHIAFAQRFAGLAESAVRVQFKF